MRSTIAGHRLEEELEGFDLELFRSVFLPIKTKYWLERVERQLHMLQVLNYSFRDTLAQLGHNGTLSAELSHTYWTLFCKSCLCMDGAIELLSSLHGRYPMGIVSNGIGEAQRGRLEAGNLSFYFTELSISDEVGHYKPNRQIFDHALEAIGAHRQHTLCVGDSLTDDYEGARQAGIDFCYYNPERKPIPPHVRPAYTIHSLMELIPLLENANENQRGRVQR